MVNKISGMISTIAMSALATFTPSIVSANEIALTFEAHGVTIAGEYAGFQANAYIVVTTAGLLHVPAVLVSCEGVDCLDFLGTPPQDS